MVNFKTTIALSLGTLSSVVAHQALIDPPANWLPGVGGNRNSPAGTINGPVVMPALAGGHYDWGQDINTESFTKAFAASKYTSLRNLIELEFKDVTNQPVTANRECGLSQSGGPIQALPATSIKWDGFSHWGPAEVWCDDVRVFQGDNVAVTHPSGVIPYDKSKCEGKKQLRSYWLGLHVPLWQVYIGCAAIGSGNPVPTTTTSVPTPSPTPPVTVPPSVNPTPPPPTTTSSPGTLSCNYEGQTFPICRTVNDFWSYENGKVCVGISRCVQQSPPYGIIRA